jgi:preprotein translocase subunit SecY
MFTGGAFSQAVWELCLTFQPLYCCSVNGIAIHLQNLQSDGESGRKKINQITRWLTIVITLVQGLTSIIYRTLPSSAFLLGLIHLNSYFSF